MFLRPKYNGEVNFDWSASSDPIFERVSAQHTMDWKLALSFIMMSSSFSIDPYFCINSKQIKFFNSQFYLKVLSNSKRALVFLLVHYLVEILWIMINNPFWKRQGSNNYRDLCMRMFILWIEEHARLNFSDFFPPCTQIFSLHVQ